MNCYSVLPAAISFACLYWAGLLVKLNFCLKYMTNSFYKTLFIYSFSISFRNSLFYRV